MDIPPDKSHLEPAPHGAAAMGAGLTSDEAARRLARDGPNLLPSGMPKTTWSIVRGVLREPMFLMLLVAGGIYLALGDRSEAFFYWALYLWLLVSRWCNNARRSVRTRPCAICRHRVRWSCVTASCCG